MKEFIEKLIGRLEEEKQRLRKLKNDTITLSDSEVIAIEEGAYNFCKKIVNELAEEYNNDFCEWKYIDSTSYNATIPCRVNTMNIKSMRYYTYCPYCGKKIKVVE